MTGLVLIALATLPPCPGEPGPAGLHALGVTLEGGDEQAYRSFLDDFAPEAAAHQLLPCDGRAPLALRLTWSGAEVSLRVSLAPHSIERVLHAPTSLLLGAMVSDLLQELARLPVPTRVDVPAAPPPLVSSAWRWEASLGALGLMSAAATPFGGLAASLRGSLGRWGLRVAVQGALAPSIRTPSSPVDSAGVFGGLFGTVRVLEREGWSLWVDAGPHAGLLHGSSAEKSAWVPTVMLEAGLTAALQVGPLLLIAAVMGGGTLFGVDWQWQGASIGGWKGFEGSVTLAVGKAW